jgi:hypothetical protein
LTVTVEYRLRGIREALRTQAERMGRTSAGSEFWRCHLNCDDVIRALTAIRLIVEAHPEEFSEIAGILDGVDHATYAPKLW